MGKNGDVGWLRFASGARLLAGEGREASLCRDQWQALNAVDPVPRRVADGRALGYRGSRVRG